MPDIPCQIKVTCPGNDLPFRNFSSEAPDVPSEPIPFGGIVTPYVPPALSPESGGGTGLPTCPTGFRYNPATGTCISNALFPPPTPPGCEGELFVTSARVGQDGCGWVDMKDLLNSFRLAPVFCDGCNWVLTLKESLLAYSPCQNAVLEVHYRQNGMAGFASLQSGSGDIVLDFTPSECFCLENMHFTEARWGNDIQGYLDVKDILNKNIIGRNLCFCPGYPEREQCCGTVVITLTRDLLGDFAPGQPHIDGRLTATSFYYGVRQTRTGVEGNVFGVEFQIEVCPDPPPDPPPPPPRYNCVSGVCVQDDNGSFATLEECQSSGCEDVPPACPPGYYYEPLASACVTIANPCGSESRYFGILDPSRITFYHAIVITGPNDPNLNNGALSTSNETTHEMCVSLLPPPSGGDVWYLWYIDTWPDPGSFIGTWPQ